MPNRENKGKMAIKARAGRKVYKRYKLNFFCRNHFEFVNLFPAVPVSVLKAEAQ
jgi:hypothetical protein